MLKSVVSRQTRSAGKWYFEIRIDDHWVDGAGDEGNETFRPGGQAVRLGVTSQNPPSGMFQTPDGLYFASYGNQSMAEGSFLPDTPNFSIGDTVGFAVDFQASPGNVRVYVHINGVWQPGYDYENGVWSGTACDPAAGTNWVYEITDKTYYATAFVTVEGITVTLAEQDGQFAYPVPAGYNAWRNGTPDVVPPGWFPYETFGEVPQVSIINGGRMAAFETSYDYWQGVHGRVKRRTGRYYFEIVVESLSVGGTGSLYWGFTVNMYDGQPAGDTFRVYHNGPVHLFGDNPDGDVGAWADGDVCGIAFDTTSWLFDWVSFGPVPASTVEDPSQYGPALAIYVSRNGQWLDGVYENSDPNTAAPFAVVVYDQPRNFMPYVARDATLGGIFALNESFTDLAHPLPSGFAPWRPT
jgi:hypothetical protein